MKIKAILTEKKCRQFALCRINRRLFDITRNYTILNLNINRYCGSRRVTSDMNVSGNYQNFLVKKKGLNNETEGGQTYEFNHYSKKRLAYLL